METAFFFLILGTKTVRSDVSDGLRARTNCPSCGMVSDMREQKWRNYFTVFFLPIIPIGKEHRVVACSRCDAAFPAEAIRERPRPEEVDAEFEVEADKITITCRYCNGKLRVPMLADKKIVVTCPHCRRKFEVAQ